METKLMERFLMKFKKKNTYVSYRMALNSFYKYMLEEKKYSFDNDEDLIKSLTVDDIEDYFYYTDGKGYKKSTINFKIEVVKEFFSYCIKRNVIEKNITKTIDKYSDEEVKNDTKEKYIPSKSEILKLIEATYEKKIDGRSQDYINARNRFYIALLSTTGLRADEALGVKMEDIEYVDGGYMVNIHRDRVKNGIDKRVPIPPSIIKYFEEYKIQRMIANEKFKTDLLFFSSRGKKVSYGSMNDKLEELCQRASIEEKITNHCFRHFLTQHLESCGVGEGLILKILGWKGDGNKARQSYTGKANDKKYDMDKLRVCDVFR